MLPVSVDAVTVWLETPEQVKSQTFNEKNDISFMHFILVHIDKTIRLHTVQTGTFL